MKAFDKKDAFTTIANDLALELAANGDKTEELHDDLAFIIERVNDPAGDLSEGEIAPGECETGEAVALLAALGRYRDWLRDTTARAEIALDVLAEAYGTEPPEPGGWIPEKEFQENEARAEQMQAAFDCVIAAANLGDEKAMKAGIRDFVTIGFAHVRGPEELLEIAKVDQDSSRLAAYADKRRFDRILAATVRRICGDEDQAPKTKTTWPKASTRADLVRRTGKN